MAQPPSLKPQTMLKHYLISKELGAGCFGRVYEAIDTKNNNSLVALKCVSKQLKNQSPKAFQLFQAERTILEKIKNDNVVGFVDYFESQSVCFLCLEYCNEGDLEQYLKTKKDNRIPEHEAVEYFKQILNGFQSLHENNILHRDMKLPNILKHNGQLKIADLGFAKELRNERALTATVLGTPYTMAPEVLEEKPYGLSCDIYSIGVNFYQMIFGKYPFNGRSEYELIQNIKKQNINFNGVNVSNNMIDLLRKMLSYDHTKRITMDQLWQHPIFAEEQKPNANIGMQNLYTSQINKNKNIDFYKKQQQQQQQQQIVNPNNLPINNQIQQISEESQQQQSQDYQNIMASVQENKKAEQEVKQVLQYYLQEINTSNQIGKCVDSSHHLPETNINTFYPVFFMLKKVLHQQTRVLKDMQNQNNVFQCKYPNQLFAHPLYHSIKNDLKTRLETYEAFYMARKFDMEDLMQQTPDPDIKLELESDYTSTTEKFFKQTMMNYYINLQDEMERWKKTNIQNAIAFQKHIVEVLDCLGLDPIFRTKPNFNFDDYQQFKDNIDFQTRQKLISSKQEIVFPPHQH